MKLISHRNAFRGPDPAIENDLYHTEKRIAEGYYVEIDVWYLNGVWWTGHDFPQYRQNNFYSWLLDFVDKLYLHCKNIDALYDLSEYRLDTGEPINAFYHTDEDYVLTTSGEIWCYPGKPIPKRAIVVLPERGNLMESIAGCGGICSDYIEYYKGLMNE